MRYCRECGAQQPDDAGFCVQCGARLAANAESPGSAPREAGGEGMSVGAYVVALLLFSIPVAGLVLAIVWACGGTDNPHKRNLARAWLVVMLIGAALGILAAVAIGGLVANMVIGLTAVERELEPFDADLFEGFDDLDDYMEWNAYSGVWQAPSLGAQWD